MLALVLPVRESREDDEGAGEEDGNLRDNEEDTQCLQDPDDDLVARANLVVLQDPAHNVAANRSDNDQGEGDAAGPDEIPREVEGAVNVFLGGS